MDESKTPEININGTNMKQQLKKMSSDELNEKIQKMKMKKSDLVFLTGQNWRSIWSWIHDKGSIPTYIKTIITLLKKNPSEIEHKKFKNMENKEMCCFELISAMEELNLSIDELSDLTGKNYETIKKWIDGTSDIPRYVWSITTLMSEKDEDVDLESEFLKTFIVEEHHVFEKEYSKDEYRKLLKKFHPDLNKRDTSREMFFINNIAEEYKKVEKKMQEIQSENDESDEFDGESNSDEFIWMPHWGEPKFG